MKRTLYSLLSVLLFHFGEAQTTHLTVGSSATTETFNDVKFDPSTGSTVSVGKTASSDGRGNDCYIVKHDASNNIVWQKIISSPNEDFLNKVIICSNGDYVTCGQLSLNGVNHGFLCRINAATGDVIWSKSSNNSLIGETFWDVIETTGGKIAVVGADAFQAGTNCFIGMFGGSGNLLWSKVSTTPRDDQFLTVNQLPNGKLLLSGYYDSGAGHFNSFVIEADSSNGSILTQNSYAVNTTLPAGPGIVNSLLQNRSFVVNNQVSFGVYLFSGFGSPSNFAICNYDLSTKTMSGNVYYHDVPATPYSYTYVPLGLNDYIITQSYQPGNYISRVNSQGVQYDKAFPSNVFSILGSDVSGGRMFLAGNVGISPAASDAFMFVGPTDLKTANTCNLTDAINFKQLPLTLAPIANSPITLSNAGSFVNPPYIISNSGLPNSIVCTTVPPVPPIGTGTGLQGVYYNGTVLSGTPLLTRVDTTIDFELTYSKQPVVLSPAPGIVPEDKYSVRWTGQVQPMYSETYTFSALTDDGVRLWVNGVQLIDNWTNQAATEKSGSITLQAGQKYDIILEYFENTGEAITKLYWASASTPKQIIPKTQLYPLAVAPPSGSGNGLKGVYYNGTNLQGTPLLTRVDSLINFEFTYSKQPVVLSPAPGLVPEDQYSVRWTGQVLAQKSETYTFYALTDDGVRLWVNGVQLIDNWVNQGATEKSGTINLVAGQKYDIILEYFENTGEAVTKLYWSSPGTLKQIIPSSQLFPGDVAPPPTGNGNGLQGVYYSGTSLSGTPLLTRVDPTINFELTYSKQPVVLSPAPGIVPEDQYSVRWTGQVQAQFSETYTFYTLSDDGIRLWVNGVQLVDNWVNQGATEKSGSITLQAGQKYDIIVEYFENTGEAVTKLSWSSASTPKQIIPSGQLFPAAIAPPPPPANNNGLAGVYYSGTNLLGTPLLTRIDTTINFELTYSKQPVVLSPAPGIVPEDQYSVRWTGQVQPLYSETYTFYTLSDDGIRLWVNGVQLVDNWVNQGATEKSGSITLVAGQKYDIVIEYYENTGEAVTKLLWSSPSTPKQIVPKSQLFPPVRNGGRIISIPTLTTATTLPAFGVTLNPNPVVAGQPARLQVNSAHNSTLQVVIYASSGRMMRSQRITTGAGTNNHSIGTSELRPGIYFVTVTGGDKPVTLKLVVQ
jgi:hypothetical protein